MMSVTPTEQLYEIAESEGIAVEFHHLPHPILGYYFAEPKITPVITLVPQLENCPALMRCVFAEELGHYFTSPVGEWVYQPCETYLGRVLLSRTEQYAFRWAARLLLPITAVSRFTREGETLEDLADRFWVTPAFVRTTFRLADYARLLGLRVENKEIA